MQTKSRAEYSVINITTNLIGYVINTLMGFICRIVFVRILSADYLGVNGLFTNILSMLSLAELGIGSAITFALYKPIADKDESKIAALMHLYGKAYTIIGILVTAAGLTIIPFLKYIITSPPDIKENLYLIYILYLANTSVSYFFSYKSSLLTAMQRNYIVTGYSYIQTILQSILQIVFLVITKNYLVYLMIQIIGVVLYNLAIYVKADHDYSYIRKKDVPVLSKDEKKSIFWNVKALTVEKLAGVLVNSTDNIVITRFNGIVSVGLASNYTLIASTIDALVTKIFSSLTGSVGNFNAVSDDEKKYQFFKVLNLANFWMYGWGGIGIAFVSTDLVKWLYGSRYAMSFDIPLILAINFFTLGMLNASYTYKSTLGLFKYGQYIGIFTGFINIGLDIVFGQWWGVFGIYFATLISRAVTTLWYMPYAIFRYGLHKSPLLYYLRYFRLILVLIITGAVCGGLCFLCTFSPVVNTLLKFVICSVITNIMFILFFRSTNEYKYLKTSLRRVLKKFKARMVNRKG